MRVYNDRNGESAYEASKLLNDANYTAEDLDDYIRTCKQICGRFNVDYNRIEKDLIEWYNDINRYNRERINNLIGVKPSQGQLVVIDGEVYYIDVERPNTSSADRGFGGREFRIKFKDGRIVVTHNLWYNGVVPKRFKHLLKNTAEFVR